VLPPILEVPEKPSSGNKRPPFLVGNLARNSHLTPRLSTRIIGARNVRYIKRLENKIFPWFTRWYRLDLGTIEVECYFRDDPGDLARAGTNASIRTGSQTEASSEMIATLKSWWKKLRASFVSCNPTVAAGRYAGLLTIRAYHESRAKGTQCFVDPLMAMH